MAKKRNFKKPVRIVAKREGKLGGPGYLKRTAAARHKLLTKCVRGYGYRSCLGSIQAMAVWGKNTLSASEKSKLRQDREWLVRTYGAKRNLACAKVGPALRNKGKTMKKKAKRNIACAKTGPAVNPARKKRNAPTSQPRRAFSGGFSSAEVKRNFWKLNEDLL